MRQLRQQLISLFNLPPKEVNHTTAKRISALVMADLLALLQSEQPIAGKGSAGGNGSGLVDLRWRTISLGGIHRHVVSMRCPDQAFFLDGVKRFLRQSGIHPLSQYTVVFCGQRDEGGRMQSICPPENCTEGNEMLMVFHISATLVPEGTQLARQLRGVLQAIHASVRDYAPMAGAIRSASEQLLRSAPQASALLDWIGERNYLVFGLWTDHKRHGILRNRRLLDQVAPDLWQALAELPANRKTGLEWLHLPATQGFLYSAAPLEAVRACWKANGRWQQLIILGHFSRSARYSNASQVPLLRDRWQAVVALPELTRSAYVSREVRTLFDRLPKPMLLSLPAEMLGQALCQITRLDGPDQTLLFIWKLPPGQVHLVMVVMSAERFTPAVRDQVLATLASAGMPVLQHEHMPVGPHQLLFATTVSAPDEDTLANLQQAIHECAITWTDRARASVRALLQGDETRAALQELARLPRLYTELYPPETFAYDLQTLSRVRADGAPHARLETTQDGVALHIFTALPIPLSTLVTILSYLGLSAQKEVVVDFDGESPVHLTSLQCSHQLPVHGDMLPRLKAALEAVLSDLTDNDPANQLVLLAGLDIHAVQVLITLRNHLCQLIPDAGQSLVTDTLVRYPAAASALYALFAARHDPAWSDDARRTAMNAAENSFRQALTEVQHLTDDRWFRSLAELVRAGVRSNVYTRAEGAPIAIKIHTQALSFAPSPRPHREIFVHGRHVEGVHLRGGPVARGGLRLSDRPADFRTEVLELMATQVVKNGLIVPTGAKGGFVLRGGSGADFTQSAYRAFVAALLSVTDNLVGGNTVPPAGIMVAPEDADDPYLVVAADKGTATFSDLANDEAEQVGFWLGDAFASGGTHGYDHKAYGITARGAWVCVRHLFASMGIDPEQDPIRIVAIGDMGGDVFGNGLLRSRTAQLVAAFNHKHIFIDPTPDPAASFDERQRLFDLRAGWDTYNPELISKGGGVFDRAAKQIKLSSQAARALDIEAGNISGEALIQAILRAPVDLLYNGGIGTYVCASDERDEVVRDPANNAVRVRADTLRCRVVGEGGNLGFTQKGRIQFAERGGRISTDAVDNSGGVDMSDHEVNLKILLDHADFTTAKRNRLLSAQGTTVATLCLDGNRAQSRALTLAEHESAAYPPRAVRLRDRLLASGRLDLATDPGMGAADNHLLSLRPQLSVLMGLEKNRIKASLAADHFAATTPFRDRLLRGYFPAAIQRRLGDRIDQHPLADDIVHTMAASRLVDRFGLFATSHLTSLLNHSPSDIANGLMAAAHVLRGHTLQRAIWDEVADRELAVTMQLTLQAQMQLFAEELLRQGLTDGLTCDWMDEQRNRFQRFRRKLADSESENMARAAGLNDADARWLGVMPELARCGVALPLAHRGDVPLGRCLTVLATVDQTLPLRWLDGQLRRPSWGDELRHAMRREWLQRLTQMRAQALETLLQNGNGPTVWTDHALWPDVAELLHQVQNDPEAEPMAVVLLLTRLEVVIRAAG